jgi:hypothetical protein
MMSLSTLQSRFHAAMVNGEDATQILEEIKPGGLTAGSSLLVYRNNIASSLTRALRDLYKVVDKLVGKEFFNALAREFIPANHPPHGRLVDFGRAFPRFLQDFPPAAELPYLADVAALELAWNDAFHSADAGTIAPGVLQSIAPDTFPDLVIQLHPSSQLLWSVHPIMDIWSSNQDGARADQPVDLSSGPDHLLILRPQNEVVILRMPVDHWVFANALQHGRALRLAHEETVTISPDFDLEVAFGQLLKVGAICRLTLPT